MSDRVIITLLVALGSSYLVVGIYFFIVLHRYLRVRREVLESLFRREPYREPESTEERRRSDRRREAKRLGLVYREGRPATEPPPPESQSSPPDPPPGSGD